MIGDLKNSIEVIEDAIIASNKDLKFTRGMHHLIEGEYDKFGNFMNLETLLLNTISLKT